MDLIHVTFSVGGKPYCPEKRSKIQTKCAHAPWVSYNTPSIELIQYGRRPTVTWISSVSVSFKCHLRNRTRQILEIKSVIWEIKRDKFWKSKVSFEKSNASNFRNQTRQILEIKNAFEKSNATNFKNQYDTINTKRIFPFNQKQDIKIIEDKKRIRHRKFYLWYSSNTVHMGVRRCSIVSDLALQCDYKYHLKQGKQNTANVCYRKKNIFQYFLVYITFITSFFLLIPPSPPPHPSPRRNVFYLLAGFNLVILLPRQVLR